MAAGFDHTLNPYIGCAFGCAYCFAANFVADDAKRDAWGDWVVVKEGAEEQVRRAKLSGKRVFMSSATDPYQPIEARIGLTRSLVEILADQQARLTVQTRSPLAVRDIDLFKRFQSIIVNLSITTDCEEVRKKFEPTCPSIGRRLEAASRLSQSGIPVRICISPMLPIRDPREFAKRLRETGSKEIVAGTFHRNERRFAASSRPRSLEMIAEMNWTSSDYEGTVAALQSYLPSVRKWREIA